MAQTYTINCYQADHVGQTDLANMENNFEALRSTFSGAAAPANAIAGKQWFDTTQNLLKIRNDANDAWLGVMCGDTDQKMLVYRNAAMDGWAIDSGVTDTVVAVKGGTTYTTGGATAGSWSHSHTGPSHTHTLGDHNHWWHAINVSDEHDHTCDINGNTVNIYGNQSKDATYDGIQGYSNGSSTGIQGAGTNGYSYTSNNDDNTGAGGTGNTGANTTFRPAAAVVTIQYPDI